MIWSKLRKAGVLGINERITRYMQQYNPRELYPLVDDKVITANLGLKSGIAMPEIYHVFETYGDLKNLNSILQKYDSFVVKPAHGAMGNGIIVIDKHDLNTFTKSSGSILSLKDIRYQISQTLGGLYSLTGYPDQAILQYKINLEESFKDICFQGIPDIRIILFQGYPVMAMVRLPTKESDGRANLHQGAVGAGIDLRTGCITNAVRDNEIIGSHPDTKVALQGFQIPHWKDALLTAAKCFEMTNMGYLGVDIAIDRDLGPLVLELNARPGLAIQTANFLGLKPRLNQVEKLCTQSRPPVDRIETILYSNQ